MSPWSLLITPTGITCFHLYAFAHTSLFHLISMCPSSFHPSRSSSNGTSSHGGFSGYHSQKDPFPPWHSDRIFTCASFLAHQVLPCHPAMVRQDDRLLRNTDSTTRLRIWIPDLLLTPYVSSLSLSFFLFKMRRIIVPIFWSSCKD